MNINIDVKYLPHQKAVFKSNARFKGIECGRGAGKSFFLHSNCIMDMAQGKRCILVAQTQHILSTQFIPKMVALAKSWGFDPKWNKSDQVVRIGNGVCFGGSYENFETALTGADAIASGYYDETGKCKDWDWFIASMKPCFRASGHTPKHVFATTPKKGCTFDRWLKNNPQVFVVRGATIDDNTNVSDEEKAEMKEGLSGDYFRQEILGEVLDGDIEFAVFPKNIFSTIAKPQSGFRSIGIDCAGNGRDNNSFIVSDDTGILEKVKVQIADTFQLASIARQLIIKYDVRLVNIDGTGGFGKGLYDVLCLEYDFINLINFGQGAEENTMYLNARAEMFDTLAKDIENGFFVDDDEILEELELISYDVNNAGKKQLVPKDTLKKVLGRSPDSSDALALSRYKRKNVTFEQQIAVTTSDVESLGMSDEW